jgi:hypothetical protein
MLDVRIPDNTNPHSCRESLITKTAALEFPSIEGRCSHRGGDQILVESDEDFDGTRSHARSRRTEMRQVDPDQL